jgi:metallothionein
MGSYPPGALPTCIHDDCGCRVRVEVECTCPDAGDYPYPCTCGAVMVNAEDLPAPSKGSAARSWQG